MASDPYAIEPCEECGALDRDYGQHEPGCPSGFPVREDAAADAVMVYIHRSNFQTECAPDGIGPFEWVQLTYADVIRVPEDHEIAHYREGFWLFEDGSEWTDVTVSTTPRMTA